MIARSLVVVVLCLLPSSVGFAQLAKGKVEPPDAYEFAPEAEYVPKYLHDPKDGKRIVNPDFFCTQCAREGRIDAKVRADVADKLEVTKRYPYKFDDGRDSDDFGKFRLVEHDGQALLDLLMANKDFENPVFIEDGIFRIFTDLEGFSTKQFPYPRREIELQELADIFPKISKKTVRLDSHHRAHLYLLRAHRLLRDFQGLVGYSADADYMTYLGPYIGMKQKFEIYIFQKQQHCGDFIGTFLGQGRDLDGICWHTLQDRAMLAVMHGDRLPDVHLNNTFTHRLTYNLITGFRSYSYDLPVWVALGFAHLMERRERTDMNTFVYGEGKVPEVLVSSKWKVFVRKEVASGRLRSFAETADITRVGGVTTDEHLIIWSLASYLMQQDISRFGKMIHVLKDRKEGESMRNLVIRALRVAYGASIVKVEEDWKEWVLATYPSV